MTVIDRGVVPRVTRPTAAHACDSVRRARRQVRDAIRARDSSSTVVVDRRRRPSLTVVVAREYTARGGAAEIFLDKVPTVRARSRARHGRERDVDRE